MSMFGIFASLVDRPPKPALRAAGSDSIKSADFAGPAATPTPKADITTSVPTKSRRVPWLESLYRKPKESPELLMAKDILAGFGKASVNNNVKIAQVQVNAHKVLKTLVQHLSTRARKEDLLPYVTYLEAYVAENPLRIEGYIPKKVRLDKHGNDIKLSYGDITPKTPLPQFNGNSDLGTLLKALRLKCAPKESSELRMAKAILVDFDKAPEKDDDQAIGHAMLKVLIKLLNAGTDAKQEDLSACAEHLKTYVQQHPTRNGSSSLITLLEALQPKLAPKADVESRRITPANGR